MIRHRNKGILLWITGLSGSGKTTLAKKIHKQIVKKYGPTLLINGDEIRKIFLLNGFSFEDRKKIAFSYSKFFKKITDQKINVLFAGIALNHEIQSWNRKNIVNYLEIFIKSKIKDILAKNYKPLYKKTNNIVGLKIKSEFPLNPDILIHNNFKSNINQLSKLLINKIAKELDNE